MERKKLLVWGTTSPEFSTKYYETVCTGAIDVDAGRMVRIYPLTLRHIGEPFGLYDWIEADIERNVSDPRPESHKIRQDTVKVLGNLDTQGGSWRDRRHHVLRPSNVFQSVAALVEAQQQDRTSLGMVRPKRIVKIYARQKSDEERAGWEEHREMALRQKELFVSTDSVKRDLRFIPVEFRIRFTCIDEACKTEHDMSVLDWGLYVLFLMQSPKVGPQLAIEKCIAKLTEVTDPAKKECYFFLGNTKAHPQNFMIVGLFYPPALTEDQKGKKQNTLF